MADVHSQEIRSKNMAAIKNKDTKPEMLVRRFLHANVFRDKLHDKSLAGKPDIACPDGQTGFTKLQNSNIFLWLFLAWA